MLLFYHCLEVKIRAVAERANVMDEWIASSASIWLEFERWMEPLDLFM